MRSLYEKLNRLDDSFVASKTVVKKKKLAESHEQIRIEVKFEPYTRYGHETIKTARVSGRDLLDALLKMADHMRLYVNSDYADTYERDHGVKLTAEALLERIEEQNGDGCDFIFYIKDLTNGKLLFDSEYDEIEDWDDDIDEMLTESDEDTFEYAEFIPEEMTQFFCINEEDDEDPNEYMPEKGYRGYKAVASLIACGDYAEELRDCGYQYALLINDPADNFFVGYVAGDRIYKLTEEDIYDQISVDYDDDMDEMLTENR